MKYIGTEKAYYFESNNGNTYRLCGGVWEQLYGLSWEPVWHPPTIEELEEAFEKAKC